MAKSAPVPPELPVPAENVDPSKLVVFRDPGDQDPVLKVLEEVTNAITRGESIMEHTSKIEALIHGQEGRAELVSSLMLTHDYGRLMRFLKTRHVLETELLASSEREDLEPYEKLAYLEYTKAELKNLESKVHSNPANIRNLFELLKQMDYQVELGGREMVDKLRKTSPMAREVVRKIVGKLRKVASKMDDTEPLSPKSKKKPKG